MKYTLDDATSPVYPITAGSSKTFNVTIPPTYGYHNLTVTTYSGSAVTNSNSYQLLYGSAYLLHSSPVTTTDNVVINAVGPAKPSASTTVTASVKWRLANSTSNSWNTSNTAIAVTATNTSDFVALNKYVWSSLAAQTDSTSGTNVSVPTDTPVNLEIQICFNYLTGSNTTNYCTSDTGQVLKAQRTIHAFGANYPTAPAGVGNVSLVSGEFEMAQTDVSIKTSLSSLTISRTHTSYSNDPTGVSTVNKVFGPGWLASFDGSGTGLTGSEIADTTSLDGHIQILVSPELTYSFVEPTTQILDPAGTYSAGNTDTDTDGLTATVSAAGTKRTLTVEQSDGTASVWTKDLSTGLGWQPVSVTEAGNQHTTTYQLNAAGQVTRILAPVASGITCTTLTPGCATLNITYGSSNNVGEVTGQVKQISYTAYDPATKQMLETPQTKYVYNANKTLASVTDLTSNRTTSYGYDSTVQARIVTVTPPGLASFHYQYNSTTGTLTSVTRDTTLNGSPVRLETFVYNVAVTNPPAGFPQPNQVSTLLQTGSATYGAAVFGADYVPQTTDPATLNQTDAHYAHLFYTDSTGATVVTANPAKTVPWIYAATEYSDNGLPVRTFQPAAVQELQKFAANNQTMTQSFIDSYAQINKYNDAYTAGTISIPAGSYITDSWNPIANLGDTTRTHTSYVYDEGAPNSNINQAGRPYLLQTTVTVGEASSQTGSSKNGYIPPPDNQILAQTKYGYDPVTPGTASGWDLATTTSTTTGFGGNTITRKAVIDTDGKTIETIAPLSNVGSNDYGDIKTIYYSTTSNTSNPACGNKPEWAGLVCWNGSVNASNDQAIPALQTSYDYYLQPVLQEESVAANATKVRTTTLTYAASGQITSQSVTLPGNSNATLPVRNYEYDSTTGLLTKISDANGAITISYDTWGRQSTYTNTYGDTSVTTYVPAGQIGAGEIASFTDPTGTTTYSYGGTDATGNTEYRSLQTQQNQTVTGSANTYSYKASFDDLATPTRINAPNGLTQTSTYNYANQETSRNYTGTGAATWTIAWSRQYNLLGQVTYESAPAASSNTYPNWYNRAYSYDANGRLTQAKDWLTSGCQTRNYTFDSNGNRLSLTKYNDPNQTCNTLNQTTTSHTYDLASRITTTNGVTGQYVYDSLGRETNIPGTDTPNGITTTLSYYADDTIRSITQGTNQTTYSLDAAGRQTLETITDTNPASQTTTQKHYTDSSGAPSYSTTTGGSNPGTTKYLLGMVSAMPIIIGTDGIANIQITDPHGDNVSTVKADNTPAALTSWNQYDEYGNQQTLATPTKNGINYGWAGKAEKTTTASGLILMGARVYNSLTGRFTSRDPVAGGNENAYNYPNDPINGSDWTGCEPLALTLALGLMCLTVAESVCLVMTLTIEIVKLTIRLVNIWNHKDWSSEKKQRQTVIAVGSMIEDYVLGKIFGGLIEGPFLITLKIFARRLGEASTEFLKKCLSFGADFIVSQNIEAFKNYLFQKATLKTSN